MRHGPLRLLPVFLLLAVSAAVRAEDWNQFRGPRCDGVTAIKGLPLTWSAAENRLWKRELPGPGPAFKILAHNTLEDDETWFNASPVPLAGGRLLLRSDWGLHCLGAADGKETP